MEGLILSKRKLLSCRGAFGAFNRQKYALILSLSALGLDQVSSVEMDGGCHITNNVTTDHKLLFKVDMVISNIIIAQHKLYVHKFIIILTFFSTIIIVIRFVAFNVYTITHYGDRGRKLFTTFVQIILTEGSDFYLGSFHNILNDDLSAMVYMSKLLPTAVIFHMLSVTFFLLIVHDVTSASMDSVACQFV